MKLAGSNLDNLNMNSLVSVEFKGMSLERATKFGDFPASGNLFIVGYEEDVDGMLIRPAYKINLGDNLIDGRGSLHSFFYRLEIRQNR